LLVDDNDDALRSLAVTLTDCKALVQTASSPADALEILKWFEPDVLISDVAMPGEDGCSLISKIRDAEGHSGKRVQAIALTALVRVEDRARALAAGFNMFVPKPVEPKELVDVIAHLVESREPV
jgi:CheY-like chemotaxis protein